MKRHGDLKDVHKCSIRGQLRALQMHCGHTTDLLPNHCQCRSMLLYFCGLGLKAQKN